MARSATLPGRQALHFSIGVYKYTARALGYLRRGVEHLPGATPHERREFIKLRTDKDLDVFRKHPEFQKLLADWARRPERGPPPREVK